MWVCVCMSVYGTYEKKYNKSLRNPFFESELFYGASILL